jgi:N-acetylated-alpha-linked acidic dipeptidase
LASLPKIPVQPISYNDAKVVLSKLGGKEAPQGWTGKLDGLTTYRIGGEFSATSSTVRLRLSVANELRKVQVTNVIGVIRGSAEPDRYVSIV